MVLAGGAAVQAADAASRPAGKTARIAAAAATPVAPQAAAQQDAAEPVTRSGAAVKAQGKPALATLVARIDLAEQRMHVTANGEHVGTWKISSGASGYETPPGRFRPQWTSKMHYSRKYDNSPMPYSVFFNRGIATHGTQYTSRLGRPASHGCIRLTTANAREFYNLVHRHGYNRTRIVVTGQARQTYAASRNPRTDTNSSSGRRTNADQGARRHSLDAYERRRARHNSDRVRSYYQTRRFTYPGDR
ncbi:MAG: L,D-transpeptidase [Alphaproteobacteria bacterium]|nr:L,D-transpeptidase [Alphaproteobacteria bacterium]